MTVKGKWHYERKRGLNRGLRNNHIYVTSEETHKGALGVIRSIEEELLAESRQWRPCSRETLQQRDRRAVRDGVRQPAGSKPAVASTRKAVQWGESQTKDSFVPLTKMRRTLLL